jgi:hypothetical protein
MPKVGTLIEDVLRAYADADQTVAPGFGAQQNPQAGGLQTRYDAEEREFRAMCTQP